jgi:hypothetical protein
MTPHGPNLTLADVLSSATGEVDGAGRYDFTVTVTPAEQQANAALVEQHLRERDEMAMDADRYRWLRSEEVATDPIYYPFWEEFHVKLCRCERMDELVDKWMDGVPEPEPDNELLRDDGALGVGA